VLKSKLGILDVVAGRRHNSQRGADAIVFMRLSSQRGAWVRVACLLAMALVCAMGIVQAVHAHPENSTSPHHVCSICSTPHVGLSTAISFAPPVLNASRLVALAAASSGIFRSPEIHFIRPPPAV